MNTEELNALKDRAYKCAVEHGFHEEEKSDAFYLGLVMSEAGEAINADRKGRHADIKGFEENFEILPFEVIFKGHIKDSVEDLRRNERVYAVNFWIFRIAFKCNYRDVCGKWSGRYSFPSEWRS